MTAPLAATADPGTLADDLAAAALWLARRFSAGATLWTWSATWPSHARHVAVEFVHPVGVGARALPAFAIDAGDDPAAVLRTSTRSGDVVVLLEPGDTPAALDVARRAPAWGVETLWLGAGPAPAPTGGWRLWLPTDDHLDAAECFPRLYHVLWELTHVCFEHPGLLEAPDEAVCTTCRDDATVAEVESVEGDEADVVTGGEHLRVDVSLVGAVRAGDLVLVHAGTAIAPAGPVP